MELLKRAIFPVILILFIFSLTVVAAEPGQNEDAICDFVESLLAENLSDIKPNQISGSGTFLDINHDGIKEYVVHAVFTGTNLNIFKEELFDEMKQQSSNDPNKCNSSDILRDTDYSACYGEYLIRKVGYRLEEGYYFALNYDGKDYLLYIDRDIAEVLTFNVRFEHRTICKLISKKENKLHFRSTEQKDQRMYPRLPEGYSHSSF